MASRLVAILLLVLFSGILAACGTLGTLPPAVPISDLGGVQGAWRGDIQSSEGATPVRVLIHQDGTYEWWASKKNGRGVLALQDGALHGKFSSGLAWVAVLRESQGKRALFISVPNAGAAGRLVPDQ